MKKKVDLLIINNCPAFYKINLYNRLSEKCNVYVIFIGFSDQVVIYDSFKEDIKFPFEILSECSIEKRNKLVSVTRLFKIMNSLEYQKIIYGGYSDFENQILMWFTSKKKNCLQLESSIIESKLHGIYAIVKKIFLSRFDCVLPSGKLQTEIFKKLNYKGQIIVTNGVGIFFKKERKFEAISAVLPSKLKYIYVGRLIPLKNLRFLIEVFNRTNRELTIVGTGEEEAELKAIANKNINFVGFVDNQNLSRVYLSHHVFLLASLSEPWGLVVEEAIFYGLPVLISDRVGCQEEIVISKNTGILFSPMDKDSLVHSMDRIESDYLRFKNNCLNFDFEERDNRQVESYYRLLQN